MCDNILVPLDRASTPICQIRRIEPQGKQSNFFTSSVPIPLVYILSLNYTGNYKNIKQYACGVLWLQKYLTHTKSIPALDQLPCRDYKPLSKYELRLYHHLDPK